MLKINPFTVLILSSVIAAFLMPIIIGLLYKLNVKMHVLTHKDDNMDNKVFLQLHGAKNGTPKAGGLIWIILFPIISFFVFGNTPLNWILIIFTLLVGIFGLIDDIMGKYIKSFAVDKMIRNSKFLVELTIGSLLSYLLIKNFNLPFPMILTFPAIVFLFVSYTNAFNINDGLDGLLTGQVIWIFTGLLILTIMQGNSTVSMYCAIMLGILIVFLYFNINPARVFMGDSGSTSLGVIALILAIASNNFLPFVIMTIPSIITVASSAIQIISIKYFKRKVFKIAPLHHHFEAMGWSETKVTERYWLAQTFFVFLAIAISTLL